MAHVFAIGLLTTPLQAIGLFHDPGKALLSDLTVVGCVRG
jgi:hypothetical protein